MNLKKSVVSQWPKGCFKKAIDKNRKVSYTMEGSKGAAGKEESSQRPFHYSPM